MPRCQKCWCDPCCCPHEEDEMVRDCRGDEDVRRYCPHEEDDMIRDCRGNDDVRGCCPHEKDEMIRDIRGDEEERRGRDPHEEKGAVQRHVHEISGSVMIAEPKKDPHNHRFAGVSGEAIPIPGGHVHDIDIRTDFYENHFHRIVGRSGPAIPVGDRHVHYVMAETTMADCHVHQFRVASLIDDPIGD